MSSDSSSPGSAQFSLEGKDVRIVETLWDTVAATAERAASVTFAATAPSTEGFRNRAVALSAPRRALLADTARYTIQKELGRGGMGRVFTVLDEDLRRTVAFKSVILPRGSEVTRRFIREAQVGAQLSHPNILPVYDLGAMEDGTPYISMPVVHGRTLASVLAELTDADRPGRLSELIDMFLKVCDAIGYAHARGIVHCDIKPSNILVGHHGEVRVIDWGLARKFNQPYTRPAHRPRTSERSRPLDLSDPEITLSGQIIGTPMYMAPEQADGRTEDVDQRSDVYMLGGLLFEMLNGRPPNLSDAAEGLGELLRQIAARRRAPTYAVRSSPIPCSLAEVCDRALALNPRDRYASAAELASAVRRARLAAFRGTTIKILLCLTVGIAALALSLAGLAGTALGYLPVQWTFWGALICCSLGLVVASSLEALRGPLGEYRDGEGCTT